MNYRDIMNDTYNELNNKTLILNGLVNSYRLLIGGAAELNNINVAKKSDVKEAVERADNLGEVIDELIKSIKHSGYGYIEICDMKGKYIQKEYDVNNIFTEIDKELNSIN